MIPKAEMLHRLHALVDRARYSMPVCAGTMLRELEALEREQAAIDTALAAVIDMYQDGLYRKHNTPPDVPDIHGLLGKAARRSAALRSA